MGKTGKWLKNIWAGKKHNTKQKNSTGSSSDHPSENQNQKQNPTSPVVVPRPATPTKDKKRWSFRRSSATSPVDPPSPLTATEKTELMVDGGEDNAALKIQSVFRSYLARKALKALRGLVKLQALVRGHLVRKQATATLRCMQALMTAQARARAQRIRTVEEAKIAMLNNHRHSTNRRSNQQEKITHPHFHDIEENVKIVEMDHAEHKSSIKIRNSYSNPITDGRTDDKISTYYTKHDAYGQQIISPAPSATTDISPRTCSGYFEDYTFPTAQTSPQCYSTTSRPDPSTQFTFPRPDYDYSDIMSYDYPLHPNYMSNTQSSRAKARSQSAPKQRPEYERQPSRGRRTSIEGRGIPKGARMQRSSSQVGSTTGGQHPWSVKLDKSMVSVVDSECGSNYSVLTTNANHYCTSVVSYEPRY